MIKRFIILLLAAFTILELQAQSMEKCGTSYNDAIPVAFSKGKNVFTDLRDTSTGPPNYYSCRYVPRDGTLSLNEDKLMLDGTRLLKSGTDSWQTEQGFIKVKNNRTAPCRHAIQMATLLCMNFPRKPLSAT